MLRPNEILTVHFKRADSDLVEEVARFMSEHPRYLATEQWVSPSGSTVVYNLTPRSANEQKSGVSLRSIGGAISQLFGASHGRANSIQALSGGRTLLKTGYVTVDEAAWANGLKVSDQQLQADDSGGIAAFCMVEAQHGTEQVFCWSTRPPLRSWSIAEAPDYIVVSTRPRLAHEVARRSLKSELDKNYVNAAITGWSLGDLTPFTGTQLAPVDALLLLKHGRVSYHRHPTRPYQRARQVPLDRAVDAYCSALREASAPLKAVEAIELRLSGGKDSRLLAALLHDRKIKPSVTLCFDEFAEWEGLAAKRVAEACNLELTLAKPQFNPEGNLLKSAQSWFEKSDGFLCPEPRQIAVRQYDPAYGRGRALMIGHMEYQRGAWVKRMSHDPQDSIKKAHDLTQPFRDYVSADVLAASRELVDGFIARTPVGHPLEYLYWSNYQYRSSRWLLPQVLFFSHELVPTYLLVDEKVMRVVSELPLFDLVSERLAFSAVAKLAPILRDVPLFQSRYRFEAAGPNREFKAGYEARTPIEPIHNKRGYNVYTSLRGGLGEELCEIVRSGPLRDELRELSAPDIWSVMADFSPDALSAYCTRTGRARTSVTGYMWMCFQINALAMSL